jgi:hypothetical protein
VVVVVVVVVVVPRLSSHCELTTSTSCPSFVIIVVTRIFSEPQRERYIIDFDERDDDGETSKIDWLCGHSRVQARTKPDCVWRLAT